VSYHTGLTVIAASGAENQIRILRPNTLLKELHDQNIMSSAGYGFPGSDLSGGASGVGAHVQGDRKTWTDNHGLAWLDPSAKSVWTILSA